MPARRLRPGWLARQRQQRVQSGETLVTGLAVEHTLCAGLGQVGLEEAHGWTLVLKILGVRLFNVKRSVALVEFYAELA